MGISSCSSARSSSPRSATGSRVTALTLHLEESTGSGIAVSALFIALWAPLVVFAGPVGLLADRFDTRRVVVHRVGRPGCCRDRARVHRRPRPVARPHRAPGHGERREPARRVRPHPDRRQRGASSDRERTRGDGSFRRVRRRPAPRRDPGRRRRDPPALASRRRELPRDRGCSRAGASESRQRRRRPTSRSGERATASSS